MRLTSFYANSLQYKLLNVHISKKQKSSREDERAMEILRKKTEEVSYPLGETDQHEDQSWKTFCTQCILKEELSDTDSEALTEELN